LDIDVMMPSPKNNDSVFLEARLEVAGHASARIVLDKQ
jgi:hypothetical protein